MVYSLNKITQSNNFLKLSEDYYELLKGGQLIIDGVPVLSPLCLIVFKAKAWLDLTERRLCGEHIDSKNIKKHKNDVFRLAQLVSPNTRMILSDEIKKDMETFLSVMVDENVDLKAIGVQSTNKDELISLLHQCYGLRK